MKIEFGGSPLLKTARELFVTNDGIIVPAIHPLYGIVIPVSGDDKGFTVQKWGVLFTQPLTRANTFWIPADAKLVPVEITVSIRVKEPQAPQEPERFRVDMPDLPGPGNVDLDRHLPRPGMPDPKAAEARAVTPPDPLPDAEPPSYSTTPDPLPEKAFVENYEILALPDGNYRIKIRGEKSLRPEALLCEGRWDRARDYFVPFSQYRLPQDVLAKVSRAVRSVVAASSGTRTQ